MTHSSLQGPHFSKADFDAIPDLEDKLLGSNADLRQLIEGKKELLDADEYLDWLLHYVTREIFGVTNHASPKRERGSGRRKAGSHSESKHR